jgi:glycosyltransferase involved in cell wall biosynthesis
MKICYVTLGFTPAFELGGPIQNSYQLLRRLVKQGVEVTVCCTNLSGKSTKLFAGTRCSIIEGIEVIYFNAYKLFPLGIGSFGAYYAPGMKTFCQERLDDYSLIHLDGYRVVPNMLFSMYARKKRIPYVIQARGTLPADFNSIAAKRIFDVLYGRKDSRDAAGYRFIETEKRQYLGFAELESLVHVIGCGIDEEEYREIPDGNSFRSRWDPESRDEKSFPMSGESMRSRIDHLIRACAGSAYRSDLILLIAGPDERNDVFVISGSGLCDQIKFIGRIDGFENVKCMRALMWSFTRQVGIVRNGGVRGILCGAPSLFRRIRVW